MENDDQRAGELDTEGQTGLASGYGRRLEFLMVVGLNPGIV